MFLFNFEQRMSYINFEIVCTFYYPHFQVNVSYFTVLNDLVSGKFW